MSKKSPLKHKEGVAGNSHSPYADPIAYHKARKSDATEHGGRDFSKKKETPAKEEVDDTVVEIKRVNNADGTIDIHYSDGSIKEEKDPNYINVNQLASFEKHVEEVLDKEDKEKKNRRIKSNNKKRRVR